MAQLTVNVHARESGHQLLRARRQCVELLLQGCRVALTRALRLRQHPRYALSLDPVYEAVSLRPECIPHRASQRQAPRYPFRHAVHATQALVPSVFPIRFRCGHLFSDPRKDLYPILLHDPPTIQSGAFTALPEARRRRPRSVLAITNTSGRLLLLRETLCWYSRYFYPSGGSFLPIYYSRVMVSALPRAYSAIRANEDIEKTIAGSQGSQGESVFLLAYEKVTSWAVSQHRSQQQSHLGYSSTLRSLYRATTLFSPNTS